MDRECLYPGHPDQCTPWHDLERDGGRRMITRVLVKVWARRHPDTTGADLAVLLTLAAHVGPDTTVELDYDPIPEIRYHTVVWETGEVGVIEVLRDPAKIPYRVARDLGNLISVGEIYVRHGTQVEQPTPGELAALEAEGRAARAR